MISWTCLLLIHVMPCFRVLTSEFHFQDLELRGQSLVKVLGFRISGLGDTKIVLKGSGFRLELGVDEDGPALAVHDL